MGVCVGVCRYMSVCVQAYCILRYKKSMVTVRTCPKVVDDELLYCIHIDKVSSLQQICLLGITNALRWGTGTGTRNSGHVFRRRVIFISALR